MLNSKNTYKVDKSNYNLIESIKKQIQQIIKKEGR